MNTGWSSLSLVFLVCIGCGRFGYDSFQPNNQGPDSDFDGIADASDGQTDSDGDGIPDYLDDDDDGDGIPTAAEHAAEQNAGGDLDGDGIPAHLDDDSDNDGLLDDVEGVADVDRDGLPAYLDVDSDSDGLGDGVDCAPSLANVEGTPAKGEACDGPDQDRCIESTIVCANGSPVCDDSTDDMAHRELCDGLDNDCDPSTADGEQDPGVRVPCDGTDSDTCPDAATTCVASQIVCDDSTNDGAGPELCDGADNDCNPATADGSADPMLGAPCDGSDADLCPDGSRVCQGGALLCNDSTAGGSYQEVCDGVDNDCNAATPDGSAGSCVAPAICVAGGCSTPVAASCLEHYQNGARSDGVYNIDLDGPGGESGIDVYCDMTTAGGGWMLVARTAPGAAWSGQFFGWAAARGSLTNDNDAYALGVLNLGVAFNEMLVGRRGNGKTWATGVDAAAYRITLPSNWDDGAYNNSAVYVRGQWTTLLGPCNLNVTANMLGFIGHTGVEDLFFFRDNTTVLNFGLLPYGWSLAVGDCSRNGNLHGFQGMIFVR